MNLDKKFLDSLNDKQLVKYYKDRDKDFRISKYIYDKMLNLEKSKRQELIDVL
jgi:hypothetical protein